MNFTRVLNFRADAEAEYYLRELKKETGLSQSDLLRLGLAELMRKSKNQELVDYGEFINADLLRQRNRRKIRGLTYIKNVSKMLTNLKLQGFNEGELKELKGDLIQEARAYGKEQEFLNVFYKVVEAPERLKLERLKYK
jgi:hypothetical protein